MEAKSIQKIYEVQAKINNCSQRKDKSDGYSSKVMDGVEAQLTYRLQ
jgi:hypothetical protein